MIAIQIADIPHDGTIWIETCEKDEVMIMFNPKNKVEISSEAVIQVKTKAGRE